MSDIDLSRFSKTGKTNEILIQMDQVVSSSRQVINMKYHFLRPLTNVEQIHKEKELGCVAACFVV